MDFLAKNLNYLRRKKGKTQEQCADFVEVKKNTWSDYERSKTYPNYRVLMKISDYFDISERDLIRYDLSFGYNSKNEMGGKNTQIGYNFGNESGYKSHKFEQNITDVVKEAQEKYKALEKDGSKWMLVEIIETQKALIGALNEQIRLLGGKPPIE